MAKSLKPGQKCVVLLPDSVRNYMSKFLNDDWMSRSGFMEDSAVKKTKKVTEEKSPKKREAEEPLFNFGTFTIKDLKLPTAITVESTSPCAKAVEIMEENHFDQLPIILKDSKSSSHARAVGLVTLGNILSKVAHGRAKLEDPVSKIMFRFDKTKHFMEITVDMPLKDLSKFFDSNSSAVVTEREGDKMIVKHVVTKIDLVAFMVKRMAKEANGDKSPAKKKQRN